MLAFEQPPATEEEYFALEARSPLKHEFIHGRIYAMAGGSPRHAALIFNVCATLSNALRGKPCQGTSSEQRIKIEAHGLYTYPDAVVFCPDARFEKSPAGESLLDPVVVIEVLSPSTERYDRTDKFELYQTVTSLQDYILISQDHVRLEHYRRHTEGWLLRSYVQRENVVRLESVDMTIALDDIYERLEVPEGWQMLREIDAASE